MLIFSDHQMNAAYLGEGDERLVSDITTHLREHHLNCVGGFPDAVLAELIEIGLVRARGHGFVQAEQLCVFVVLMFVVAPNFDQHPRISALLCDGTATRAQRWRGLCNSLPQWVWDEARAAYDDGEPLLVDDPLPPRMVSR